MIIKRLTLAVLAAFSLATVAGAAQKTELPDWQNPQVVQRNRLPMASYFETDGLKLTLNGYGDPVYKNVGYAWNGHYKNNPPFPADWHNYAGQYRRTFELTPEWKGKDIFLHIGSATSNVRVWVNGKEVGYSEDSKLEARLDITKYVRTGENLIALEIFRWCDGTYLEDQDLWRLTGLARDTYIYSRSTVWWLWITSQWPLLWNVRSVETPF